MPLPPLYAAPAVRDALGEYARDVAEIGPSPRPADRGRLWPEYAVCCADCAVGIYVGTRNQPRSVRALTERGWSWYGAGVGWVCPACVAAKSEQREACHG
jgi:hypothetical protein